MKNKVTTAIRCLKCNDVVTLREQKKVTCECGECQLEDGFGLGSYHNGINYKSKSKSGHYELLNVTNDISEEELKNLKRSMPDGIPLNIKDKNGCFLYSGDIVKVQCELYSGSHSRWYQKTHDRHYQKYFIEKEIYFDYSHGSIRLKDTDKTKEQIKNIEKPHGNEKIYQHLAHPSELNYDKYVNGKHVNLEIIKANEAKEIEDEK